MSSRISNLRASLADKADGAMDFYESHRYFILALLGAGAVGAGMLHAHQKGNLQQEAFDAGFAQGCAQGCASVRNECKDMVKVDPRYAGKQQDVRERNCQEYDHPACSEPIDGQFLRDTLCFTPKYDNPDSPRREHSYRSLMAGHDPMRVSYDLDYCLPAGLDLDKELFSRATERFMGLNSDIAEDYGNRISPIFVEQFQKNYATSEKEKASLGERYEDFVAFRKQCHELNADSSHSLIPTPCLLVRDFNQEPKSK